MEECEGVGYGERIIGQGFAPTEWDLVCIAEVGESGACEKGSSLLQKEQFTGWTFETR